MERKQVKEILNKQLQLLELTLAMCQVADCLKEEYVTVSQKGMTDSKSKNAISSLLNAVLQDPSSEDR